MQPIDAVPLTDAIRRYPTLAGLLAIVGAGWRFVEQRDDCGISGIYGFKQRDGDIVDAILIRSETDVTGMRGNAATTEMLWQMTGTLADVVGALHGLGAS